MSLKDSCVAVNEVFEGLYHLN